TASGTTGPTLTQAGTYFVIVQAGIDNSGTSSLSGTCRVAALHMADRPFDSFNGAFNLPARAAAAFSFSGMLVVGSGQTPATTQFACLDNSGNAVTPTSAKWW